MKKAILLIAVAILFCGEMKAQDMAGFTTTSVPQLALAETQQADIYSIYSVPMPTYDFSANNSLTEQQYASRKGWGIFCIVAGASTMLGGVSMWLFGDMFNDVSSQVGSGFEDDPDFQQGQEVAQTVGNGVKTIGIVGAVTGAALVGTGIWLVSSDGGSKGHRGHGRRGGHRRSRRHSELMPTYENMQPDWGLSLNIAPTSAGLTFVF